MSPWVFLKHFLKASGIMTTNARTSKLDMNGLYRLALMSLSLNSGYLFATGPDMTLSPWTASGSVISSAYKLSKYIPTVRRETTPVPTPSQSVSASSGLHSDTSDSANRSGADDRSQGLYAGTKARIGVGVALFAILLAAFLTFTWRRQRCKASLADGREKRRYEKPELEGDRTQGQDYGDHSAVAKLGGLHEKFGTPMQPLQLEPVEFPAERK